MRPAIVIVGPVHPHGGGIAQHVARLAAELQNSAFATVTIESWKAQYPRFLHRAQVTVKHDQPEVEFSVPVSRILRWYSPFSWIRVAYKNRGTSAVLFNVVTPFHAIPIAIMRMFLFRSTRLVALVHNAQPHERSLFDRLLLRVLMSSVTAAIVHDQVSEEILLELSGSKKMVARVPLPSPWGTEPASRSRDESGTSDLFKLRVLFFGHVRAYKGVPLLLEAMSNCREAHLTIAGTFWGNESETRNLIRELGLEQRVEIRGGYVQKADIPELFGRADVVAMPYLSGTASVIPELSFSHGVPVIATNVGGIAQLIEDGRNGLIVESNSVESISRALTLLSRNSLVRANLRQGAQETNWAHGWDYYCRAVINLQ